LRIIQLFYLGRFGLMHRSKQLKSVDHFVGVGEQKMRDCDARTT
jgi:hypothetical protein